MAEKNTVIVTAEDKEMQSERDDEMRAMKSEMEAHLKQMQDKINEMEMKVNNMDQLTKDLDGFKANLHVQTERLDNCEMLLKEGLTDMKMVPMLEEMREETEKMKVEQTRMALKANDDSEAIFTVKAKADVFIQLLEQKDEKTEKKLNEHKTNINAMMDAYKTQLEDVKTTIASMDTGSEKQPRAVVQLESKVLEMIKDLQKQYEWLTIMKQPRNGNSSLMIDTEVTTMGNEAAIIDNGVAPDDNVITTINNDLVSIKKKVAANVKKATTTDNKVDAIKAQITDIDKGLTAIIKRMTWIENWQKKLKNIGPFGTLSQRDGCLVSEFTFTVKNIGEEINKAKNDSINHCIESEPFYTNIMGYKAKIQVFPNDRNSNYVGVYLSLVEGKFDDNISWPFICKYEFSSVGRDGNQFASFSVDPTVTNYINSFMRPKNKSNTGYGTTEYIKIMTLLANKDKYLIDGGLKIKTTIWLDI